MRMSWKVMTVVLVSALVSVMAFSKCGHERCHRSKRSTWIEIMISESVTDAFYKVGNLICRKCDPGQYMQSHCQVNHTQSNCTSCPPDAYNPNLTRARKCRRCTDCNKSNAETVARCTATSDAECRCPDGYGHLSFDDTGHGHDCVECAARGNISVLIKDKDERFCIHPCPVFKFYDEVAAECKQCTDCEASGNVTIHRCNSTADTVCERPPPATTAGDTKKEKTNGGLAGGSIAAIVVSLVVVMLLAVVGLYCCYRKHFGNKDCMKNSVFFNTPNEGKEERNKMIE